MDAELRAKAIDTLTKQNDLIGKLMRDKPSEEGEKPSEPAAPEEISDEAILQALGLDPDDPYTEQTRKATLPLVRKQIEQDQRIAQLIEFQELAQVDSQWRGGLSAMEKEFGALPAEITHERVMDIAAEEGIGSPMDAYWRIVGPARAGLSEAMAKINADKQLAAKKAAAGTRPSSTEATGDAPLEAKNAKAATKEVAADLLAKLGIGT